jgi:hypothetical protein
VGQFDAAASYLSGVLQLSGKDVKRASAHSDAFVRAARRYGDLSFDGSSRLRPRPICGSWSWN